MKKYKALVRVRKASSTSYGSVWAVVDARSAADAYSDEIHHQLRFKTTSQYDPNLPLIPIQTRHRLRFKLGHSFRFAPTTRGGNRVGEQETGSALVPR